LKRHDWHESLRLVYAIQFLDYDTQRIRGIQPKEGEEDLDRPFIDEIQVHPMGRDEFMKHYVMTDQNSGQTIKRGMHLIQIELPRITSIKALSPREDNFTERSKDFSLSDWWCCVLKHAEEFDVASLENEYEYKKGKFVYMPEPVYNAFRMLRRETWGPDLQSAYDRDDLEIEKYSTAIAVERAEGLLEGEMKGRLEGREEGRLEGEMKGRLEGEMKGRLEGEMKGREEGRLEGIIIGGLIGEFIATGKLSPKSLKRIKQNPPNEDWIGTVWKAREAEMAGLESDDAEEEEVPDGRTFNDFIAYLRAKEIIREEED
jgi:hypothetical protein